MSQRVKGSKSRIEQIFSGLPLKADSRPTDIIEGVGIDTARYYVVRADATSPIGGGEAGNFENCLNQIVSFKTY